MKTKLYLLPLIFSIFGFHVNAQDLHFSDYQDIPILLNPALTADFDAKYKSSVNYRAQGKAFADAYSSAVFVFEMPLQLSDQQIGIGAFAVNDQSNNNVLIVNKIGLSVSYFLKVSEKSYLHGGFQGAFVQKSLDFSKLTLPDRFDYQTGMFDSDVPTADIFASYSERFGVLNSGTAWTYFGAKQSVKLGVSLLYINRPEDSFLKIYQLPMRTNLHAEYARRVSDAYVLRVTSVYAFQSLASELLFGVTGGKVLNSSTRSKLYAGLFFRGGFKRTQDAGIAKIGYSYEGFDVSISQDINISAERKVGLKSTATELNLSFSMKRIILKDRILPCEMF